MGFLTRPLSILLLGAFAISAPAFADGSGDRTQFGRDITISPNEKVTDVTCFGCSIRVRGQVGSDVTAFFGSVILEDGAQVGGDTTTFGGDVRLDSGVKVQDVTVFGGSVRRDPAAEVAGDITNFRGTYWLLLIFGLPFLVLGAFIALIIWLVRRLTRPALPVAA